MIRKLKQQFSDFVAERKAASPVIGVILMVAITVILAAVIGIFIFGLGDSVDSAPQAQLEFNNNGGTLTVVHNGGDPLEEATLSVKESGSTDGIAALSGTDTFTAGDQLTTGSVEDGETVSIVWTSENGDTSVIGEYTAPA